MRKILILSALIICTLFSCEKDKEIEAVKVLKVEVNGMPESTVDINQTIQLTTTVTPEDATYQDITWTSSDAKIATVSDKGIVTTIAEGSVTITATATTDKVLCNCTIEVKIPISEVTSIVIDNGNAITVTVDEVVFNATALPEDAVNRDITWSITKGDEVGMMFENGLILFSEGTCTVTATTANGVTADCVVTFKQIPVETIIVKDQVVTVGQVFTIKCSVLPEDASNKWVAAQIIDGPEGGLTNEGNAGNCGMNLNWTAVKEGVYNILYSGDDAKGSEAKFTITVKSNSPSGECVDLDGKEYKTVVVNGLTWMAENYAYMPSVNTLQDYSTTEAKQYVYAYEGTDITAAKTDANYIKYGSLYNFTAANSLAPAGWRLPTHEEVKSLEVSLGMTQEDADKDESYGGRGDIAWKFWKEGAFRGKGTNESGLSLIAGGTTRVGGADNDNKEWYYLEKASGFWTSNTDPTLSSYAFARVFKYFKKEIIATSQDKSNAYSVRYVKE